MPVKKYRSVADMPGPPLRQPLDADNLRIACELSETARAFHPRVLAAGVKKFRSARESQQHREQQERHELRPGVS